MEMPFEEIDLVSLSDDDSSIEIGSDTDDSLTRDKDEAAEEDLRSVNILDKAASVDEADLAPPLEPTHAENLNQPSTSNSNSGVRSTHDENLNQPSTSNSNSGVRSTHTENLNQPSTSKSNSDLSNRCGEDCEDDEIIFIPNNVPLVDLSGDEHNAGTGMPDDDDIEMANAESELETDGHNTTPPSVPSILRRSSTPRKESPRSVSFPGNELCTFRGPESCLPYKICTHKSPEELLEIYRESCKKHKTVELDTIKSQIMDIRDNKNFSATLNLKGIEVTREVNETLEDLFQDTNFRFIILISCTFTPDTMNEFMNMVQFYRTTVNFSLELPLIEDATLNIFCHSCGHITDIESISFKKMKLSESLMRTLMNCINVNLNINILRFDDCALIKLPNFYLIESLKKNTTIRELYLPSAGLYTKEAEVLAKFLMVNTYLKILDIGNNFIGDRGLESLSRGLCTQNTKGLGLCALSVFNNQITEKSGPTIKLIIVECKNLHSFNLGYNNLTDQVLISISAGLSQTTSLQGLGLQCTLLTCRGMEDLSRAIVNNASLRKMNLKGNKAIQVLGITTLCQGITQNQLIYKVEIDMHNRSCADPEAYNQLVLKLNAICAVNKSHADLVDSQEISISQMLSRRMSLSCEPRYTLPTYHQNDLSRQVALGAQPPAAQPDPPRRVDRINEEEAGPRRAPMDPPRVVPRPRGRPPNPARQQRSRFQVTRVLTSPDEELSLGRFANVRSSVSSNDSLDSLSTAPLDTDSDE